MCNSSLFVANCRQQIIKQKPGGKLRLEVNFIAGLIVSENIFHAADLIITPLIPTTLSKLTHEKLMGFFEEMKLKKSNVYPFFSMVERQKKLHQELMAALPKKYKRFLKTVIPYSSVIERMGIERAPVEVFEPGSIAARAFSSLWAEIKKL